MLLEPPHLSPIYKLSTGGFRFAGLGQRVTLCVWPGAADMRGESFERRKLQDIAETDEDEVRKSRCRGRRGRAIEEEARGNSSRAGAEPTFQRSSGGTGALGRRGSEPGPKRNCCPVWRSETGISKRNSDVPDGGPEKGESRAKARWKPDRNRPGPQGLGRNRTGDPPKQRCGRRETREGKKEAETHPTIPIRPAEGSRAFGQGRRPRESGGWWQHRPPLLLGRAGFDSAELLQ